MGEYIAAIGVIVAVGVIGWRIGIALPEWILEGLDPDRKAFSREWEARAGRMMVGGSAHPPPGLYRQWKQAHKETGCSAAEFLDWLGSLGES